MVAVSDAKDRDPHPFARPWEDPNERTAVLAKMQAFARAKLTEYGVVPGVTPATAIASTGTSAVATTPAGPEHGRRATDAETWNSNRCQDLEPRTDRSRPQQRQKAPAASAKPATATSPKSRRATSKAPPPVALADEDLKGYLLSYGGAPTYVYMAHTS